MENRRSMLQIKYASSNPITILILAPPPQSQFPAVDEAELKKMDEQIATLQEKLKERQEKFHSLETGMRLRWLQLPACSRNILIQWLGPSAELASLRSSLTSEEAKAQLALLEKEVGSHIFKRHQMALIRVTTAQCAQMTARLKSLKSG